MSKIPLYLTLLCTCTFASVLNSEKQQKRDVIGNEGWIGLSSPYEHRQPWSIDHNSWRTGLKLPGINLHAGMHLAGATYGSDGIALTPEILKTPPVYITKHVLVEKPVPVPEPIIIEKPYHVPVPIEKIVHKPIPVPVPIHQAVPIPVERPVPIPVKQPYPVPVPVPIPVPLPPPSLPLPPPSLPLPPPPLIPAGGLAGAIYARDYASDHLYVHPLPATVHLDHGIASHGLGHVPAHGYGHDYDYHVAPRAHADEHHLAHEHKKRKTDKNDKN